MQVEGWGHTKPMVGGHLVIEAEGVNGFAIQRPQREEARVQKPQILSYGQRPSAWIYEKYI
jgi:hypothetical protein